MLKKTKLAVLRACERTGISSFFLGSRWRQRRLMIFCWHGISIEDEHLWNPSLYITQSHLRSRFEQIRANGCQVLPLGEAIERLYADELPEKSVALTFDDGWRDFYQIALPIIQEFGYPVTSYVTTYYSYFNRPVFDPAVGYLLWKRKGERLVFPEIFESPVLLDEDGRSRAHAAILKYATYSGMSGGEKDQLLASLAAALRVDYDAFCAKRLLQNMTPDEIRLTSEAGIDIQLHTHRHRVYDRRDLFDREIDRNRELLGELAGRRPRHFCYPGGVCLHPFPKWLRQNDVISATTCIPGIASPRDSPFELPRLVDTGNITATEFGGWIAGVAQLFPKRLHIMEQGQLIRSE